MRVWRIASIDHPGCDGEGARLFGGRWNHQGTPMVYAATSVSLAVLEFLVHLDASVAPAVVQVEIVLPRGVRHETLAESQLPPDWRTYPSPDALKDLGTAWARRAKTLVLVVPSAITGDPIALINPGHAAFRRIGVKVSQFNVDPRLVLA